MVLASPVFHLFCFILSFFFIITLSYIRPVNRATLTHPLLSSPQTASKTQGISIWKGRRCDQFGTTMFRFNTLLIKMKQSETLSPKPPVADILIQNAF